MSLAIGHLTDVVFDIGDYVEITQNRRGTIKYEGNIKFVGYIVGIELDETISGGTDGTLLGVRYFKCPKKRATFVKISKIKSIIKPHSTQNRIRKALHLPLTNNTNTKSSKKKKAKKQKQSKIKKKKKTKPKQPLKHKTTKPKKKKKQKKKFSNIPSLLTSDSNSSTGSTGSSGSSKDEIKPSFSNSASAGSASLASISKQKSQKSLKSQKKKIKQKLKKRSEDTTSITASPVAPPRTPRPRLTQRRRATSSLTRERERFLLKKKDGNSPLTLRRKRNKKKQNKSPKNDMTDINDKLKYNLKLLCALGPLRKRQEALKQCATILSDKQLHANNSKKISVFSFEKPNKTHTNTATGQNPQILDSLTLKYFVDSFKKAFWKQLQDKKVSIQKDTMNLFHILVKNHWIYIKKYVNFYLKKILLYFEKNDIKSTHKFVAPVIKSMIKCVSPSEDKIIIVHIMCELIQFATKSHSKMVKKNCWNFIGLLIKKQIKYRQELPSASSSPSYAMGGKNRNYSFSNKSPKNLLDILQSGLKKGISDSDKATQAEAMSVLTMFSFLDETRAERLISRMNNTLMRQYNISKKQHRLSSISSPRASILTSPKNSLASPRSKSLQSPKIAQRMLKIKKKRKKNKFNYKESKIKKFKKAAIVIKPSLVVPVVVVEVKEKKEFAFVGFSLELDTSAQNNDYKDVDDDVICVLSDHEDMSSTDTDDTYSGDSGDSDDDRRRTIKKKKTSISIPSVCTNEKNHDTFPVDDDDVHSDSDEEDIEDGKVHTFSIKSMRKTQKKPFCPSLNCGLMNKSTNYDRNTNYKAVTLPTLTRPSSAKFGSNDNKKQRTRTRVESLRPGSARASG